LLDWFDRSQFITSLLGLGRSRKEEIEAALECLVDGYDDSSVPETSAWGPLQPPSGRPAEDVDGLTVTLTSGLIADYKSGASILAKAADEYRRPGDDKKAQRVQRDSERKQREAERLESFVQRFRNRKGVRCPQTSGARRRWLTPVLADLDEILQDVEARWEMLAQLVRELEAMPRYDSATVRMRVTEYRRRNRN
jgi:hypothetical protein